MRIDFVPIVAPYVKAVVSDIKKYQRAQGLRPVPVGYDRIVVDDDRIMVNESRPLYFRDYLECGNDTASNVDFLNYSFDGECFEDVNSLAPYSALWNTPEVLQIPQVYYSSCGDANRTFNNQDFYLGPNVYNEWSGSFV